MNIVLLYHINNGNWINVCEHQSAFNCLIKGKYAQLRVYFLDLN